MTLDQIIEEAHRLPREQVAELIDRLTLELHQTIDPTVEAAWKQETRHRLTEIQSGTERVNDFETPCSRIYCSKLTVLLNRFLLFNVISFPGEGIGASP